MKITLISDTHGKHDEISDKLEGGDLLIHAGDISSKGYVYEVTKFLKWFDSINGYEHKIFIAGNHDYLFEQQDRLARTIVEEHNTYGRITYLCDESVEIYTPDYEKKLKIYGSPWQPWFHNWAFNLPRNGVELENKWNEIPDDVDILITHGPPYQILDYNHRDELHVGCEKLADVIFKKNPMMHVFGHIHEGRGWLSKMDTHFFNATVLNGNYGLYGEVFNIEWDWKTNRVKFL